MRRMELRETRRRRLNACLHRRTGGNESLLGSDENGSVHSRERVYPLVSTPAVS